MILTVTVYFLVYNFKDHACGGKDTKYEDFPLIYFARPFPGSLNHTVCVRSCPHETDTKVDC